MSATRAGYVPAREVREHAERLRAAGLGYRRIATLAGVSSRAVLSILTGKHPTGVSQESVRADVAERILAVRPSNAFVAGRRMVDATGTRRRLQALVALGWSRTDIARHGDMLQKCVGAALTGDRCVLATARKVHAVYELLWDQEPPTETASQRQAVSRARSEAARNRWARPMDWDEDAIDDPAQSPAKVRRVRMTAHARLDELMFLAQAGLDLEQAAQRAGYGCMDSAQSVAARQGHPVATLRIDRVGVAA